MTKLQGRPVWYELSTAKGALDAAGAFYAKVLDWDIGDSGMEGFTYHLAKSDADMVAGLMEMPEDVGQMPPMWMIYFGVEDADRTAAAIAASGGTIHREPADIPDTGRFAIAGDPQGAGFGILAPLPMQNGGGEAFNQQKVGHGNWNELMSADPDAGFSFYANIFGWQKSTSVEMNDMKEMGIYQLFSHDGQDIGGMMGLGDAPASFWLPYFGTNGVTDAIGRIEAGGGTLIHGPHEVPGGAWIAVARDPQGAHFAVVGPKERTT
jgi:predicted enzyme related to lactoylglutathione lyase